MSETQYEKYLRLTKRAQELFEKPAEAFEASARLSPEVLSQDEEKRRLDAFQNSFYINPDKYTFKHIEVFNTSFLTISREDQNMAIGPRFTAAYSNSGENLIDTDAIQSRDDARAYYVNHEDGFAGFMACMSSNIALKEPERWRDVAYVEGEVYVSYTPGSDVLPLSFNDGGQTKTFEELSITVNCIEPHRVQLMVKPESVADYDIAAYDDQGRLLARNWSRYPVFEGDMLAKDFTEENLPEEDKIKHYIYCFHLKGQASKIDLYFSKIKQSHWLPFKAPGLMMNPDWDDFKTVDRGPSYYSPPIDYYDFSEQELIDQIQCVFARSEALMELNTAEIKVELPEVHNTNIADFKFKEVCVSESEDAELQPVDFDYSSQCITDFSVKFGKYGKKKIEGVPGKTRFKGAVVVNYPASMEWITLSKENPSTDDGHKVEIDGGLVTYTPPEEFRIGRISKTFISHYFKAFDKAGRQLKIEKSNWYRSEPIKSGVWETVKLGVWGQVAYIELAICRRWQTIEKEFDLIAGDYLEKNPAEEMLDAFSSLIGENNSDN